MKKTVKRLLATALAGVMTLSCVVFASASQASNTDGVGAPDVSITAADNGKKSVATYAGGHITGSSSNEGAYPNDRIRVELPTVAAKVMDMYLDPHGLIEKTNAARYQSEDYTVDFADDTTLYFLNEYTPGVEAENEGEEDTLPVYKYTNTSQELTITNKSSVDVDVDVVLRVNKGSASSAVSFVADTDALAAVAEGTPGMYLALVSGGATKAVADATVSAIGVPTITVTDADNLLALEQIPNAEAEEGDPAWINGAAKTATFRWDEKTSVDATLVAAFKDKTIAVATDAAKKLTVTPATISETYKSEVSESVPTAGVTNAAYPINVTVTYYTETTSDSVTTKTNVAYVDFVVAAQEDAEFPASKSATLTIAEGDAVTANAQAKYSGTISQPTDAYVEGWTEEGGYYLAFIEDEDAEDIQAWGYDTIPTPDYSNSALKFKITGAINSDDAWDGIGGDIDLDLIWDVHALKVLNGTKPVFAVTQAATGTTTSKRLVKLSFTAGDGDYAGYAPASLVYDGVAAGADVGFSYANNVIQYTSIDAIRNASKVSIVCSATGKNDITFDISNLTMW